MRAEIQIRVFGDGFPTLYPNGVSIYYPMNEIPVVELDLDANALALICDFEQYRRALVTVEVLTTKGCLYFDGLVDGLSFAQTQGSISNKLIIKNRFQLLREVVPKLPGLTVGSANPYQRNNSLKVDGDSPDQLINKVLLTAYAKSQLNARGLSIPRFIINFTIAVLDELERVPLALANAPSLRPYLEIVQQSEAFRAARFPLIRGLLLSLDTQAVDGSNITAGDSTLFEMILQTFINSEEDLFSTLVNLLNAFGCSLIFGNTIGYVVPDAGFLSQPHFSKINVTKHSSIPNVIFPAEYTDFSFNDNGYKDIKGVILDAGPNVNDPMQNYGLRIDTGRYFDPTVSVGGIMVAPLPRYMTPALYYAFLTENSGNHKVIQSGQAQAASKTDPDKILAAIRNPAPSFDAYLKKRYEILDNMAQMEYLKAKYSDRSGSIVAIFDTGWAPGAIGTIYTRNPGTYIDMFVTSVNHQFRISSNSAQANTYISFRCGRVGNNAAGTGLGKVNFHEYDYLKARAYCNRFINNVTT